MSVGLISLYSNASGFIVAITCESGADLKHDLISTEDKMVAKASCFKTRIVAG